MKLFMIIFSTAKLSGVQVYSYVDTEKVTKATHYQSDGFYVERETNNCWFLDDYPDGMPRQYRKADEYKLLNNSNGIYMFGRDSEKLINEWNNAAVS